MDFGRLLDTDFDAIDFSLPPEPQLNEIILAKRPAAKTQFYIGCAKWGRKDWIGTIYPQGTKEAEFLNHYGTYFNAIELNASFYRMPSASQTAAWRKKVPASFRFCPKVTGQISHIKRLKDVQQQTERFVQGIKGFENNLGPVFLMPHPSMTSKTLPLIEAFHDSMPRNITTFVEVRHADWFEKEHSDQMFKSFIERGVGTVITDVAGRRDCVHMTLTVPKAFVRFVGNGLHPTDYKRIDAWVDRMKNWQEKGIHEIYFFMHQHNEVHSPELCRYVIQKINEICNAGLPVPEFIGARII